MPETDTKISLHPKHEGSIFSTKYNNIPFFVKLLHIW